MKNIYFILFFSFFIILPCYSKGNNDLKLIKEDNYFNDFKIIDDKVYIECKITIKNNTGKDIKYRLSAIFKDDVRIGLLKNEILERYSEDLKNNIFIISANEIIKYQIVIFIGDFAGNYKKYDRVLPKKINIILLE